MYFFCLFYLKVHVEPVSICVSSIKLSITHPCHSFSATPTIRRIFKRTGIRVCECCEMTSETIEDTITVRHLFSVKINTYYFVLNLIYFVMTL